jgi:hypothetical protein
MFCHVLDTIGFHMKGKLGKENFVFWRCRFGIHRYVAAPIYRQQYFYMATYPRDVLVPLRNVPYYESSRLRNPLTLNI